MPIYKNLHKVMVIGSGPIVIGQAAEFDYAGTQACKALKEEGIEVVLVNSNPATIMTDEHIADKVYIQPITIDALTYIIDKERPDGLIPSLGGQTGLNMAVELNEAGVISKYGIRILGTPIVAIKQAEDRERFKELMLEIHEPVPESAIVTNLQDGVKAAERIGYPVIIRPAYTLGGTGGGIAGCRAELERILHAGLTSSRIHQALVEKSVAGWKEIEYEVIRDSSDMCVIVCSMENVDPVGIHTGDSIVVAPAQTISSCEDEMLRRSAIKIIRALKIEGGCNIQFALDPLSGDYYVIEVNPRVSRSSALASKATGYPIARVAVRIAAGIRLDEMYNSVTGKTMANYEPQIDYVVVKIPKWPYDKFGYADRTLGTQMKATGEVMAIDRIFESALLKAVISLEGRETGLRKDSYSELSSEEIRSRLGAADDERIFLLTEALRRRVSINEIHMVTKIDPWFLGKINNIVMMEEKLAEGRLDVELLKEAEALGFTDTEIMALSGKSHNYVDTIRRANKIYPVYGRINACSCKSGSSASYYYSTYGYRDENVISRKNKIIVIGSGPIRIGQGIEFDYCSVHAAWALQKEGYEAIMINNNPETVSTDIDTSDKLYFEPLFVEDVCNVIRKEMPRGVIVQFGGQTAINLAPALIKRGVQILGTSVDSIDAAEDRERFSQLMRELGIKQPEGKGINTLDEAKEFAGLIGYPVLARPSYVIGGRGIQILYNDLELTQYLLDVYKYKDDITVFIDRYIEGTEVEIDGICDGEDILIPGIMEHVERTGIHSGDSIALYPHRNLSKAAEDTIVEYSRIISAALEVTGLINIQFVVKDNEVYVIEVNPRASRTVPILSKITKVPMVALAVKAILGEKLADLGYGTGLLPHMGISAVKMPVFSFQKLNNVDVALMPEMKSTGEVIGVDSRYDMALYKAFRAAGIVIKHGGNAFISVASRKHEELPAYAAMLEEYGFRLTATNGTADFLVSQGFSVDKIDKSDIDKIKAMLLDNVFDIVVNIPSKGNDPCTDGFKIRVLSHSLNIPTFTSFDTLKAYLTALSIQKYPQNITYEELAAYINQ